MAVRGGVLAAAMAAFLSTSGIAAAQSLETIDTTGAWNGTTSISSYGYPFSTATYGQTITPTSTQTVLQDITFYLNANGGGTAQSQAFVYVWDDATQRITGSALYQSAAFSAPSGNTFTPVTISTGGVTLVPGTTYAIFFTTSSLPAQAGNYNYSWGSVSNSAYTGGVFIFDNNDADFSKLLTDDWDNWIGDDLAFIMTFGSLRPDYGTLNDNQQAVANSLLSFFDENGSLPPAFEGLTADDLTRISGEIATSAISSGLHSADLFMSQISDPFVTGAGRNIPAAQPAGEPMGYSATNEKPSSVAALAALGEETPSAADTANKQLSMTRSHAADALTGYAGSPWTIWGTAYGGAQEIDGNASAGSSDLTTRNWGIATGFDYGIEDGKIGFALGGAGSSFSLDNDLGSGHSAVFNAGVYGAKTFGNAYVSAAAAYAFNSVDTSRSVFGDTLQADYDAHTLSGRVEGGYRVETSMAAITPYAAVQGSSYFLPDYSETSVTGGPFALTYDSQTQSNLRTELGARLEHIIATGTGGIKLTGRLAWVWNADNARDVTAGFQDLAAPSFTIDGAEPDRHAVLVDAGAEFGLSEKMSAKLSFNGQFSGNVSAYGASAKLSYKW